MISNGMVRSTGEVGLVEVHPGSVATSTDLLLGPVTSDEWIDLFAKCLSVNSASNWWIGALMVGIVDETCSQALDEHSERARQCEWVYRRVKPENRTDLSFTHHRLVAKYTDDEQRLMLADAQAHKLTTAEFSVYLKAYDSTGEEPKEPKVTIDKTAVRSICQSKEGKTWTEEDTRSVEFYLCI